MENEIVPTSIFSFETIEKYGLPLVLLIGAIYVLYKFVFWSLVEVKNEFRNKHEEHAKHMESLIESVAEMKSDLKVMLEFIKDNN